MRKFHYLVVALLSLALVQCSDDDPAFNVNTSLSSSGSRLQSRDCTRTACVGSPSTMSIKLYKAYISQNTDCSSPTLVTDHGSAGATVFLGVDRLISASPSNGTYRCLILEMSDLLSFTPDSAAATAFPGVCVEGATSTFDIFRTDSGDSGLWKDMNGNSLTATGTGATSGEDRIVIFGSTDIPALQAGAYAPHINQTLDLTGALTVPGQTTFFADFSNGITDSSGQCKIEGGTGMGFR